MYEISEGGTEDAVIFAYAAGARNNKVITPATVNTESGILYFMSSSSHTTAD